MKTLNKSLFLAIILCLAAYGCKKDEDTNIAGTYAVKEDCSGSLDNYAITVSGKTTLNFNNIANNFDNIGGTRSGLSITLSPKNAVQNRYGHYYDFHGGSGTISADGSTLTLSFSMDDYLYGNQAGTFSCSVTGNK